MLVGDGHVVRRYLSGFPRFTLRATKPSGPLPDPLPGTVDLLAVDGIPARDFEPGRCGPASGRATVKYLEAAAAAARAGTVNAIIGCPHNETAINAAGIKFSGYPSLLARLAGRPPDSVLLMLCGAGLNIAHVTLHEPLASALAKLDERRVYDAAVTTIEALECLGYGKPHLGIFGIDPHAGEHGLFGDADERVTCPAVQRLVAEGFHVSGPAGADLMLSQRDCDGYLAMYHDQGHIPVKLLAGRDCVAFSIGAGFLFASVGHGSAPDIAGRGCADPAPLEHTIDVVRQMRVRLDACAVEAP
ncbi:MAG: PdxA family dehydrogenase [Rhodanobacteraceae bacterium]